MRIARLRKLVDLLKALPRRRFDYNRWVGMDWGGSKDLSCGTTACALGWAATIPTFRRRGLVLADRWGMGCVVLREPNRRELEGVAAAARFFDLLYEHAAYLFIPGPSDEDATAKQVARKIERFIKERGSAPV